MAKHDDIATTRTRRQRELALVEIEAQAVICLQDLRVLTSSLECIIAECGEARKHGE